MQQDPLFTEQTESKKSEGPVTCLGKTFSNDTERKAYFTELLAEKLKDPEFRVIEGFPIGNDEDILNLSDPPYYTACPNPWIADFIAQWEEEKPAQPDGYHYHREPFAADVSEGKNDPIYNAHSYHTKVPHKAIMRYILHYTNPGDIVFDGFCGSGMTGIAAQLCSDEKQVSSLGYKISSDGIIFEEGSAPQENKKVFSKIGERNVILSDLSPLASSISYNYNKCVDLADIEREVREILDQVHSSYSWMYQTRHPDSRTFGTINYTIWSDVYLCNNCNSEIVFWESAVNKETGQVKDSFSCHHCNSEMSKKSASRVWETVFDDALQTSIERAKQVPVLINYSINGKRFEKTPDDDDIELLKRIESTRIKDWFPSDYLPEGFNTRQPKVSHGITNVHHFYTKRNLIVLSAIYALVKRSKYPQYLSQFLIGSLKILSKQAKHNKERRKQNSGLGWVNAGVAGTLYVSSCPAEQSALFFFEKKCKKLFSIDRHENSICISCGSSTDLNINNDSIDYIFIDPPFGANLNYSELSFNSEAWLNIRTNNKEEAIENSYQNKELFDYRKLMFHCFTEAYRILKPGRWITIEFSNTKSSVWNSIQSALVESGFIVANVSALDKKIGTFKAVTTTTAVKQDLVISAYKPNGGFEERFDNEAKTEDGVWDFIRTHLQYLPVTKPQGNSLIQIPERDPRILFDQLVAYYVRKGYQLPVSSQEFQLGLAQRFKERDGMYFLDEQAAEYDKKKALVGELVQTSLFVSDEASAIQWLRQLLKLKPQVFSDINPQFMQQLSGWSKNEVQLDLRDLLTQNFLCYDGEDGVPEQIHSYLSSNWKELRNLAKANPELKAKAKDRWYVPDPNKAGDLEKLRERSLLKEFEEYKSAKKKLKVFRIEAVRVGFKKLWEAQEFTSILDISSKLPNDVIAGDPVLLMYYDQAMMLSQANSGEDW